MRLVTSVVAAVEIWQQVKRRHRKGWRYALAVAVVFVGLEVWAALAEVAGDPWPRPVVNIIALMIGVTVFAVVTTVSVVSVAQAIMSVAHVNRGVTEDALAELRCGQEQTVGELHRLAQNRVEQVHQLAVWVERLDFDMQRLGELIERAREQGRIEERDRARIREAHLRDEHRAEIEQVGREQRKLGYDRGVEVGRAQVVEQEETAEDPRGLGPAAIEALRRMDRRLDGRE